MKRTTDINNDGHIGWKELDFRDKIAYIMAIVLIASGIIMSFWCFLITETHDVTEGVLYYTAQAFVTGGSLLGIGIWVKGKIGEINSYLHKKLD